MKKSLLLAMVGTYLVIEILRSVLLTEAPLLFAYFIMPGTFLHEGAHYVMALLLGGAPDTFQILPRILYDDHGDQMAIVYGYVVSYDNWYNTASVSLAPLLVFPLAPTLCVLGVHTRSLTKAILYLYGAMCVWAVYMPSSVDLASAMETPASWPMAFGLIGGGLVLGAVLYRKLVLMLKSNDENHRPFEV